MNALLDQFDRLAPAIAQHGLVRYEADTARLVQQLRCTGTHHLAADVVLDPSQPAVARERAFGVLHRLASTTPVAAAAVAA